jgi:hypothetical protein
LKLLDDLTILDDFELQYRLKVYKEFNLILKDDYDFEEDYKDAFDEFPGSTFKDASYQ